MLISTRGVVGFLEYNFVTGPGITGWLMTAVLGVMMWFTVERNKRVHFERFWYSHHVSGHLGLRHGGVDWSYSSSSSSLLAGSCMECSVSRKSSPALCEVTWFRRYDPA